MELPDALSDYFNESEWNLSGAELRGIAVRVLEERRGGG